MTTLVVDIGLPITKSYFYETYGIPEPAEGEELVIPPPSQSPLGKGGQGGILPQFAESSNPQDNADRIAEKLAIDAATVADAIYMAPLKKLVEKAKSLGDLRESVIDLYGEMDPADMGVIIAQAMSVAETTGRFEVQEETAGGLKKKA